MSAYVVNDTHIDAILTGALRIGAHLGPLRWWYPALDHTKALAPQQANRRELTQETAGRVGAMLLAENQRSVNRRYGAADWEIPYLLTELQGAPNAVVILKALNCYEYQSCEHTGWPTTEAYHFCQALRHRAIRELPGYDEAPWEIVDPTVYLTTLRPQP